MRLAALKEYQAELVRQWRNSEPEFLRTPYLLTEEMQRDFYEDVVCNRNSSHRYFALNEHLEMTMLDTWRVESIDRFIGMVGLTDIEWENGNAEISLIINPAFRGEGRGREAVKMILDYAFNEMRLVTVYGEVYNCGNRDFWDRMVDELRGYKTDLIGRKMHEGEIVGSMWFAFKRGKR